MFIERLPICHWFSPVNHLDCHWLNCIIRCFNRLFGFFYLTIVTFLIIIDQFFHIIPEFNYIQTWSVPKVLHMEFISPLIWFSLFFIKLVLTAYPGVIISHLSPLRTFVSVFLQSRIEITWKLRTSMVFVLWVFMGICWP